MNDILSVLEYLECYCIKKEISYVKLTDEFHFLDYVFKLYSREDFLAHLLSQEEINLQNEFFTILFNESFEEDVKINLERKERSFFPTQERERYKITNKKNYKVNTLGYPKRIRRR